jgi:hypothetical protein
VRLLDPERSGCQADAGRGHPSREVAWLGHPKQRLGDRLTVGADPDSGSRLVCLKGGQVGDQRGRIVDPIAGPEAVDVEKARDGAIAYEQLPIVQVAVDQPGPRSRVVPEAIDQSPQPLPLVRQDRLQHARVPGCASHR